MPRARAIGCVILDFDGTFTNVEEEAIPFLASYRQGLEAILGEPIGERWREAVTEIRADPDGHGFQFEGRIVAPAHADPYILASSVARLVLATESRVDVDGVIASLFRESYAKAATAFRPRAREVIAEVVAQGAPVHVVSNSHTEQVERKVAALDQELRDRVSIIGDAQKFVIDDPDPRDERFARVAEAATLPGLARPIYLRRGRYYEVLRRIWSETATAPEDTLVCGDIFELDLALPAELGARIHLVARPSTPAYERRAVAARDGRWSDELAGVLEWFR